MIFRACIFHVPRNPFQHADALESIADGALLVREGRVAACGDYAAVARTNPDEPVTDYRGGILLPGLVDAHTHYPQVRSLGGIGYTLLDWLENHTLPEEAKFSDEAYAATVADEFLSSLAGHGVTSALVFGGHFAPAVAILFEKARNAGLRIATGLTLSDRLLRPELHHTPDRAYAESADLIRRFHNTGRLLYAVTPRFALSSSEAILEVCQALMRENPTARFQTHLNENEREIETVRELFPRCANYLDVYDRFDLVQRRSVFAHSVHSTTPELTRMAAAGCSVAHCPASNAALGSGIFPFAAHRDAGVRIALGTDVGGGTGFGILKECLQAYLMQRVAPRSLLLTAPQLLYLATAAGAEALDLSSEIGDFAPGKAADFVYVHPPAHSSLAAVMRNAPDPDLLLAAIIGLARAQALCETWVEGKIVYRNPASIHLHR